MPIVLKLEAIMSRYGIPLDILADSVGITNVNMSRIKKGKIVAVRFRTLYSLIKELRYLGVDGCDVGDVLGFVEDDEIEDLEEGFYVSVPEKLRRSS